MSTTHDRLEGILMRLPSKVRRKAIEGYYPEVPLELEGYDDQDIYAIGGLVDNLGDMGPLDVTDQFLSIIEALMDPLMAGQEAIERLTKVGDIIKRNAELDWDLQEPQDWEGASAKVDAAISEFKALADIIDPECNTNK